MPKRYAWKCKGSEQEVNGKHARIIYHFNHDNFSKVMTTKKKFKANHGSKCNTAIQKSQRSSKTCNNLKRPRILKTVKKKMLKQEEEDDDETSNEDENYSEYEVESGNFKNFNKIKYNRIQEKKTKKTFKKESD